MHTMHRLAELVARRTPDILRAEAMGFVFGTPEVIDHEDLGYAVTGTFTCVCGREERYLGGLETSVSEGRLPWACDVGRILRELGAFSQEHLLRDGYSQREVDEILALGEEFKPELKKHGHG